MEQPFSLQGHGWRRSIFPRGKGIIHPCFTRALLFIPVAQVQCATKNIANVKVLPFDGLIMDFCAAHNACAVVRGIRNLTDFDYEAQMAAMNRKLRPQVETVFLLPEAQLACISSTLVREISKLGGAVGQMVSPPVAAALAVVHAQQGA